MPENRAEKFVKISNDAAFDVIVVGGGINGIGTFRDLTLQGIRVLLVEMNDFCSGCSAAPSRMIHGGLRYLENGEFDLVRESLRERDALLQNAPHMVRPLKTTVPIRSIFSGLLNGAANFFRLPSKPTERGVLAIKIGLMLYDWVTRRRRVLPKHELKMSNATKKRWPGLRDDIKFTATYYDAWISYPERLGIELIDDAIRANGNSVALNYCTIESNSAGEFFLQDQETGEVLPVNANVIVNATGAWLDQTASTLPGYGEVKSAMVEGTKGSHLIIDHPELVEALDGNMIYYENSDGRVCILFPYSGKVLVGSTDIRVSKPGRTRCELEEQDYILQSLNYAFPDTQVDAEQVVFSYSGIRPLPKSDHEFTGRISRGHSIKRIEGPTPQFCMVGGKWTTFRAFAEQAADEVLGELKLPRKIDTINVSIGGGLEFPSDVEGWISEICAKHGISQARAEHLLDTYGTHAGQVIFACNKFKTDTPLVPSCLYSTGEIKYLAASEHVVHLSDIILRRTSLAISGLVSSDIITRVAELVSEQLHWDEKREQTEISNLVKELETYHGVSPQALQAR